MALTVGGGGRWALVGMGEGRVQLGCWMVRLGLGGWIVTLGGWIVALGGWIVTLGVTLDMEGTLTTPDCRDLG